MHHSPLTTHQTKNPRQDRIADAVLSRVRRFRAKPERDAQKGFLVPDSKILLPMAGVRSRFFGAADVSPGLSGGFSPPGLSGGFSPSGSFFGPSFGSLIGSPTFPRRR